MFDSFGSQNKVQFAAKNPSQSSSMNGLELGEIDYLYSGLLMKYRADIRLLNGQIFKKVRLPGPYIAPTGFLSGFKTGYRKGQMVSVGFLQNRRDNPIVLEVFPFAANTKGRTALLAHSAQYDVDETAVGDESGHRTAWTKDKVKFIDKLFQTFFEIDYKLKKITIKVDPTTKIEMTVGQIKLTSPVLKASNGVLEFDIHTHKHATAVPGPPKEPTPGS